MQVLPTTTDLVDPLGEHAGLRGTTSLDVLVEQPHDAGLQLAQVAGVELGERDARHEIAAEDRLGIEARHRGELLARAELQQGGRPRWWCRCRWPGRTSWTSCRRARRRGSGRPKVVTVAPAGSSRSACGQPGEHTGRHVGHGDADGRGQLLDVGGLVVLLARQRDLHQLLVDARRRSDHAAGQAGRRRPGSGSERSSSGGASSTVTDSIGSTGRPGDSPRAPARRRAGPRHRWWAAAPCRRRT